MGQVVALASLTRELDAVRARGGRIVLTNGIFDLLHVGHLRYLRQAAAHGDILVVGVNADGAVHKPGRPLVPEAERAELVAALEPVDFVVLFADRTADALLRAVRPNVYVKGADYSETTLPEAATVRSAARSWSWWRWCRSARRRRSWTVSERSTTDFRLTENKIGRLSDNLANGVLQPVRRLACLQRGSHHRAHGAARRRRRCAD